MFQTYLFKGVFGTIRISFCIRMCIFHFTIYWIYSPSFLLYTLHMGISRLTAWRYVYNIFTLKHLDGETVMNRLIRDFSAIVSKRKNTQQIRVLKNWRIFFPFLWYFIIINTYSKKKTWTCTFINQHINIKIVVTWRFS